MISGLDVLTRQLNEVAKAAAALDGDIVSLNFNPADPQSIHQAITDMERVIDDKVWPYRNNPLVREMVEKVKAHFRRAIQDRVREAIHDLG